MNRDGIQHNTITYNALIAAFGRAGEWERAEAALEQMVRHTFVTPAAHGPKARHTFVKPAAHGP
eukprot:6896253-Pyramimonas_sp.AAC.1